MQPREHWFETAEEGYNWSQCDPAISDGDVLVIERRNGKRSIAFLFEAWPVIIFGENEGVMHGLADSVGAFMDKHPEYDDTLRLMLQVAHMPAYPKGWRIEWDENFNPSDEEFTYASRNWPYSVRK